MSKSLNREFDFQGIPQLGMDGMPCTARAKPIIKCCLGALRRGATAREPVYWHKLCCCDHTPARPPLIATAKHKSIPLLGCVIGTEFPPGELQKTVYKPCKKKEEEGLRHLIIKALQQETERFSVLKSKLNSRARGTPQKKHGLLLSSSIPGLPLQLTCNACRARCYHADSSPRISACVC